MTADTEKWKAKARDLCEQLIDGYTEYDVDHVAAALAEAYAAGREDGEKAGVDAVIRWTKSGTSGQDIAAAIRAREQKP